MEPPAGTKAHDLERGKDKSDGETKERIQLFLGEFRILVPAMGALFGFQLTSAFSNGWEKLAEWEKFLNLGATSATAVAIGFLLLPANYHRVTRRVPEDEDFLHFAQRSFAWAFFFVGVGMAGSLYLQARRVTEDPRLTSVFGVALVLFFVIMWGIAPRVRAKRHERHAGGRKEAGGRTAFGSGGK
jgi:hypothetical protein